MAPSRTNRRARHVLTIRHDQQYQYFLTRHEADAPKLGMDGTPRVALWTPPPVIIYRPRLLQGDFYQFSSDTLIGNERAVETLSPYLSAAGELLPLPYGGQTYTVVNVLTCLDCLDAENTAWRTPVVDGVKLRIPKEPFTFDLSKFTDSMLFKVAGSPIRLYVVEGFREPSEEFRSLVASAGLRGLTFEKARATAGEGEPERS